MITSLVEKYFINTDSDELSVLQYAIDNEDLSKITLGKHKLQVPLHKKSGIYFQLVTSRVKDVFSCRSNIKKFYDYLNDDTKLSEIKQYGSRVCF